MRLSLHIQGLGLACGALVAACSNSQDTATAAQALPPVCSATDRTCDPYDQLHVMGTWGQALCEFLVDCCHPMDRVQTAELMFGADAVEMGLLLEPAMLQELPACRRAVNVMLSSQYADPWIATSAGMRTYDRDAGQACLAGLVEGSQVCVPGLVLASPEYAPVQCQQLFLPAVPDGGPCYSSADCVPGSEGVQQTCFPTAGLMPDGLHVAFVGTCRPMPQVNEVCAVPNGECAPGNYCNPQTALCTARAPVGQMCVGRPCVETAYCSTPYYQCAAFGGVGTPCMANEQCSTQICDAQLHVCFPAVSVDPLSTTFEICLGDNHFGRLGDFLGDSGADAAVGGD